MSIASYRIVLIGAGNVATQLGKVFREKGHEIVQVYSRTTEHAASLAKQLEAKHTTSLHDLLPADIYLIAAKDDTIESISSQLKVNGIVAHTSGSIDMSTLQPTSQEHGVLYPLQTFSKEKSIDLQDVPFCIEASNENTKEKLATLARSVSNNIHFLSSEQRRVLHLSAVFACNFTNHMYTIAGDILKENNIPFDILAPLIEETTAKIKSQSPREAQTGPAKRNDLTIMSKHIEMLKNDETAQAIYKLVSYSIAEKK